MQLHDLKPASRSTKRRKVVGRGPGSGHGRNSCRGSKGHKKRGSVNANFEGGQTPLHRRLPHLRGFKARNHTLYAVINVGELDLLEAGTVVTPQLLMERNILRDLHDGVKILGDGTLTKNLTVKAHAFSKSATAAIQALGGTVELLGAPSVEPKAVPAESEE